MSRISFIVTSLAIPVLIDAAPARGATRSVPASASGGALIEVVIAIEFPSGALAAGLEESPPAGWLAISEISGGGTYDAANHRIKWGPYFAPSIPAQVGYRVTLPMDAQGEHCFDGEASFDGFGEPIGGDSCLQVLLSIPAVSTWGLVAFCLFLLMAGTLGVRRAALGQVGGRYSYALPSRAEVAPGRHVLDVAVPLHRFLNRRRRPTRATVFTRFG